MYGGGGACIIGWLLLCAGNGAGPIIGFDGLELTGDAATFCACENSRWRVGKLSYTDTTQNATASTPSHSKHIPP